MEKSPAVPKFGSFKPKASKSIDRSAKEEPTRTSRTQEDSQRQPSRRPDHKGEYIKHDSGSHRTSQHRSRHHRRRSYSHDSKDRARITPQKVVHTDEFEESDLFIVDRRGDSKNVEYGSLHRYSVPQYRRSGYGNIIGIALSFKIDRERSTDKNVCLVYTRAGHGISKSPRLLASRTGRPKEGRLRFIQPAETSMTENLTSDYIELAGPSRKRKRGSDSPEPAQDYRSIEEKAKAKPDDEDTWFISDCDTDEGVSLEIDRVELLARQKNAYLSKQAKANARSLEAWMELVEHQENLVRPGVGAKELTHIERRTLADLRLAIIKEASSHIAKTMPDRDRLLLATIREGNFMWDNSKLAAKWQETLEDNPTSVLLWTNYLNYIQNSAAVFKFDVCKDAYSQCLRILRDARCQLPTNDRAAAGSLLVYVTLRYISFLRATGYDELAFALWQAVLEYHYNMPVSLQSSSVDQKLDSLEQFWESEAIRVGEEKAEGWANQVESGSSAERSPVKPPATPLSENSLLIFARHEEHCHGRFLLSAAADDEDAVTDPFRYVMFGDLRETLRNLVEGLTHQKLAAGLCIFLGMPLLPDGCGREWIEDAHLAQADYQHEPKGMPTEHPSVKIRSRCETAYTLFLDGFDSFKHKCDQLPDQEQAKFADRCIELMVARSPTDEGLAEYLIAFKAHMFPEAAPKFAKRLLKARTSSLRLYNAYALLLARSKQKSKALEVWKTALKMRFSLNTEVQDDAVILWHSRHLCMVQQGTSDALETLLSICEGASQLRATRELESDFDRLQLAGKFSLAAMCADLLAWLRYLTDDSNMEAALATYRKYAQILSVGTNPCDRELLHQYRAGLILWHVEKRKSYKPGFLRAELQQSLEVFPSNSIILDVHARLASEDRLRSLVKKKDIRSAQRKPSIVEVSRELATELDRAGREASGSTANNIRAVLSRALLRPDSAVTHSPALWELWLRWEYRNAVTVEVNRKIPGLQRAKQVFLDGLRCIPWHKHWIVLGIQLFNGTSIVSDRELRQWYDVLVERGLRIRYEVDEQ